jgi:hypothetical protein
VSEELPEPWRSALGPKGVHTRRGLATKAGIAPQTAVRLVNGQGTPRPDTIQAVADAFFGGDRNRVRELAGISGRDYGDFKLPPEASLLRPDQRDAVRQVIQAMLPGGAEGGEGNDRDDALMREELDPIEPTVAEVLAARRVHELAEEPHLGLAARRGQSKGRQARQTQDDAGERPDPEGPEGGA